MRVGVGVMKKIHVNETAFRLVVVGVNTNARAPVVAPAKFEAAPNGGETSSVQTPGKSTASLIVNYRLEPDIGRVCI